MGNGLNNQPDIEQPGELAPPAVTRVAGFYWQESGFRTLVTREPADGDITNKECQAIEIVELCGGGQTDKWGVAEFRLSEFTCLPVGAFQTRDIYFVATPQTSSPAFVTSVIEPEGQDIKITVLGWGITGGSFRLLNFDWHCVVQLNRG